MPALSDPSVEFDESEFVKEISAQAQRFEESFQEAEERVNRNSTKKISGGLAIIVSKKTSGNMFRSKLRSTSKRLNG